VTKETALAIFLAPLVGVAGWWLLLQPGRWVHRFLYRRLPDGRIRRLLLSEKPSAAKLLPPSR